MDISVEFSPTREPLNQLESSGSSSDAPVFLNKFSLIAQSYVFSSDSSFSDTRSSSLEDDTYEPSFSSFLNPVSNSLSSDRVSWNR
jgi:hypothetical protein